MAAHPLMLEASVCEFLYEKCNEGGEWACREYTESCVEPFLEELLEELREGERDDSS